MNLHLTHEQLCDLILADSSLPPKHDVQGAFEVVDSMEQAHLQACLICSAELKSLRDSLHHFHDASAAYARQEFAQSYARRSSIAPPHSFLSQPLYWTAAAVIFVAALFPLSLHHGLPVSGGAANTAAVSQGTTESDEALLADIEQKVSADVPSPMEPLADPIAGANPATATSNQRSN